MRKNIAKNVSKDMSGKYNPGLVAMREKLDNAKQSAINAFITSSKRQDQKKTADTTIYWICNKFANKIKKAPKNVSETVVNEYDKEIPKWRYMSPEERQEIIDKVKWK